MTSPSRRPINLVWSSSPNYQDVQRQIFDTITTYLPDESWSEQVSRRRAGALNFTLFVNRDADVLMSHGAADKNYMFKRAVDGERLIERFQYVFTPGDWLRDRLLASRRLKLSPEQVHSVGWPRLDRLRSANAEHAASHRDGDLRVLWAPTHDFARRGEEGISTSSYPGLVPFLPELQRHFHLTTSLHPRNRDDKRPTEQLLIEADVVISDFGTLVYEAWALGKPVIFPSWLIGGPIREFLRNSAEELIFRNRIGLHADSFDHLVDILRSGPELGADVRTFLSRYLLDDPHEPAGCRAANLLLSLA